MAGEDVIKRWLEHGPKTPRELADFTGQAEAHVRNSLSNLIFQDGTVSCTKDGRYYLGDSTPLIMMGT